MDKNKDIEWRDIPGYAGLYKCSECGDIYSLVSDRMLNPSDDGKGYYRVTLHKEGIQKTPWVHRLVALTFIGELPCGLHTNHIDGIKTNNNVSNLEYVTPLENTRHAIEIGLMDNNGEKNPNRKLSATDIPKIRKLLSLGKMTQKQIGKIFGVSRHAISLIKTGRTWKCVNGGKDLYLGEKQQKLSADKVRAIRSFLSDGIYSHKEIGDMFGVSKITISRIEENITWKNAK